jgi:hypothetical protein
MEVVEDRRYKKLSISLPVVVLEETDKVRGDVARSVYIRRALEQYNKSFDWQLFLRYRDPYPFKQHLMILNLNLKPHKLFS